MTQGWEDRADKWIEWARRPGFDGYWSYRDFFFDEVTPVAGRATLEVGCGEGRVARDLARRGHRVCAVDASPALIAAAAAVDEASSYQVADAEKLPFNDAAFDVVVAYNSLMDVDDMPAAVSEAARVLEPGGFLAVCVTHPLSDSGTFAGIDVDAVFVIDGSYRGKRPFELHIERDGLDMDFDGWAYDLEAYSRALEAAGLLIQLVREPAPSSDAAHAQRWWRIPNFLMFRALKPVRQ